VEETRIKGYMTLKEIAKIAGVSTTTVSYVLNDSKKVSDEVKDKVMHIVQEANYQPNRIARSLRVNRTRTIGVMAEDITFPSTMRIIEGIDRFAEQNNYNIILNSLGFSDKLRHHYEDIHLYKNKIDNALGILISLQVDGIIYIGMHDRDVSGAIHTDKPLVYTYCYTNDPKDYTVTYDNQIAYDMTRYLIEKGHKKIGIISGPINSTPSHKRLIGYQSALNDAGITLNLEYIQVGNWSYEFGYSASQKLLLMEERPTAIFALNDYMAMGAINAAMDMGLNIPEDLSVVGFDNIDMGKYTRPGLTTIDMPLEEMGRVSAEIIANLSADIVDEKRDYIFPCTIVERKTVRVF
jgi:LacI family transcriptional regulator